MALRVLFADDQIPWDSDEKNASVKQQIIEQKGEWLKRKQKDPEVAFDEDKNWFEKLIEYLEIKQGFEVTCARQFQDAKDLIIDHRDKFDIAVIDLSWTGDARLDPKLRRNIGLKLLDKLGEQNKGANDYKPVIAFSQNFKEDSELMALVLDRGALPISKDYTCEGDKYPGHQALAAAINYLAVLRPPTGQKPQGPSELLDLNKATLSWLFSHVSIPLWAATFGLLATIFGMGVAVGKSEAFQQLLRVFQAKS